MIIIFLLAVFAVTFLGGFFALRFRDKLHLVLGFSAGAVIGMAFFDLLPESIELSADPARALLVVAVGFLSYMFLDRLFLLHSHNHEEDSPAEGENVHRGTLRASSLSIHSFLDGAAIGLSFQVSPALGLVVAVAVLTHDFSDGINTVTSILKAGGSKKLAFKWLLVDALAPVLGIISTFFFTLPEKSLGLILSLFAGFFLYLGASDLVPESYHKHPTFWTTLATILGAAFLYILVRLAG